MTYPMNWFKTSFCLYSDHLQPPSKLERGLTEYECCQILLQYRFSVWPFPNFCCLYLLFIMNTSSLVSFFTIQSSFNAVKLHSIFLWKTSEHSKRGFFFSYTTLCMCFFSFKILTFVRSLYWLSLISFQGSFKLCYWKWQISRINCRKVCKFYFILTFDFIFFLLDLYLLLMEFVY